MRVSFCLNDTRVPRRSLSETSFNTRLDSGDSDPIADLGLTPAFRVVAYAFDRYGHHQSRSLAKVVQPLASSDELTLVRLFLRKKMHRLPLRVRTHSWLVLSHRDIFPESPSCKHDYAYCIPSATKGTDVRSMVVRATA